MGGRSGGGTETKTRNHFSFNICGKAAPYTTELAYLEKYNCDFVVHGDDLVVNADGKVVFCAVFLKDCFC
jgi:hypothetical protein